MTNDYWRRDTRELGEVAAICREGNTRAVGTELTFALLGALVPVRLSVPLSVDPLAVDKNHTSPRQSLSMPPSICCAASSNFIAPQQRTEYIGYDRRNASAAAAVTIAAPFHIAELSRSIQADKLLR